VLTEHDMAIAPSTYYAHRHQRVSDAGWHDAHLANQLLDLHRANYSVYGIEKCWAAMRRAGHDVGRDQVARLMAIVGVSGVRRGQHTTRTTVADRHGARHPDLVKRAWHTPAAPDVWWVADFTYVWTLAGFAYTSFVTDVYSRRILGWRVSMSKATPLVMSALEQALFTRRRHDARFSSTGLVFHSDAGSQYTAITFTEALIDAGIAPSIGTVGDALDKAVVSYCTSGRWLSGSSFGKTGSHLFDEARVAWRGGLEEPDVLVVGLVGCDEAGPVPVLDGGGVDIESVGKFGDCEHSSGFEAFEVAWQAVGAA
jgi:transposase InsO family protein